jgi:tRNA pseudouridine38-40 synthase
MQRYFIELAYKGTNYHGWQIQPNGITVQEEVDYRLKILLGDELKSIGCGRTDTGVHASKFIAHFDTRVSFDPQLTVLKLNKFLPKDIVIHKIYEVPPHAHARFSAIERTYLYRLHTSPNPFINDTSAYWQKKIDRNLLLEATERLIQYKNFSALSKINSDYKNYLCDVYSARWIFKKNSIFFFISANRFLRGMVRIVVSTLLDIAAGNLSLTEFNKMMEEENRRKASSAAIPNGLFLYDIKYRNDYRYSYED